MLSGVRNAAQAENGRAVSPRDAHPLSRRVAQALHRESSRPAVEFEGRWFTCGEIRHVAERVGALIEASAAPARAPIVLVPRNQPSAMAALFGLVATGYTVRMVYPFQSAAGIARDVERLQPAAVIAAAEEFSEAVCAVLRRHGIAAIVISESDAAPLPGFERCGRRRIDVPAESSIEVLTSGTTGPPKQFPLSYDLILEHHIGRQGMVPGNERGAKEDTPALLFFPLGNISGIYSTLPAMVNGKRMVLLDRFSVAAWHDYVLRFRPTVSSVPPAAMQAVLDADIAREDLASIGYLRTGAAPLDPALQRAFEKRYEIPLLLSYGATEFGGPVTAMTPELYTRWGQQKLGSVGQPLPGVQLRVTDPDTGEVLPPGRQGILDVISPCIGPQWIRSADLALIDEDGFVFHRGRADGAIVRGGFKVLPETIERALRLHPAVAAVAVAGIPDRRLGQVPAAAIELKRNIQGPSIDELEQHLREHVLATHIPAAWRFVAELPKNRSMKIDQLAVRRLFEPL
jgi:long-chain acyl-CoA synthetase